MPYLFIQTLSIFPFTYNHSTFITVTYLTFDKMMGGIHSWTEITTAKSTVSGFQANKVIAVKELLIDKREFVKLPK